MTKKEYKTKWDKEHKEEQKAYRRRIYAENPQKVLKRNKAYADAHPMIMALAQIRKVDLYQERYREKSRQYQIEHPEVYYASSCRYHAKPEVKEQQAISIKSLKLVRNGTIPQSNCKCGAAWTLLYHNDYIDPRNIEFCCKECFWKKTKERYRLKKLKKLSAILENT